MAVVARDGFTFVPAALMILRPIALRSPRARRAGWTRRWVTPKPAHYQDLHQAYAVQGGRKHDDSGLTAIRALSRGT
jgi:hypothetical protein